MSECNDVISKIYILVDNTMYHYHHYYYISRNWIFSIFLINSQRNCWATISMLLYREIRIYTYIHIQNCFTFRFNYNPSIHPSITRLLLLLLLLSSLPTLITILSIIMNWYFRSLLLPYLLYWLVYNNVVSNSRLIDIWFLLTNGNNNASLVFF